MLHTIALSLALAAILYLLVLCGGGILQNIRYRQGFPTSAPSIVNDKGDLPVFGSTRFFRERWVFFRDWTQQSLTGNFSYYIGKNQMVSVTGPAARQRLYNDRGLNFEEGINLLFNFTSTINSKGEPFANFFLRRITAVLQTNHLETLLPHLVANVRNTMTQLGASTQKTMDPFDTIYSLVFQLTMRTVGCIEAAIDPQLTAHILKQLSNAESATTAFTIIFPWFPFFPAKLKRTIAFLNLYSIFCGFFRPGIIRKRIASRQANGKAEKTTQSTQAADALEVYLNFGDTELDTFTLIVAAMFSGQVNSGMNASWMLLYLAAHPDWAQRCLDEMQNTANTYAPDKSSTLYEKLQYLPLSAWETQLPVLDACLRETIRLQTIGVVCRKNVSGKPIPIAASTKQTNPTTISAAPTETIPPNAYVTHHLLLTHLDPSIYTSPSAFDPDRYSASRAEDKKEPLAYLGWGGGRHVCAGMRLAKLENAIVLAHALARFEWTIVGGEFPRRDDNASTAARPLERAVLAFRERDREEVGGCEATGEE